MSPTTKGDYLTRIFEVVVGRPCTYAMHCSADVQRCGDEILRALEPPLADRAWIQPGASVDVACDARFGESDCPSDASGWMEAKVLASPDQWGDVNLAHRNDAAARTWAHWKYLTPAEAE